MEYVFLTENQLSQKKESKNAHPKTPLLQTNESRSAKVLDHSAGSSPATEGVEDDLCARTAANGCTQILSGLPKGQEAYAISASSVQVEVHGISLQ